MTVDGRMSLGALHGAPRRGPRPAPKPTAERARVLIVDDDERNLLAIQTVLEDVAEVVVATSGEEALRHLLKSEFAVILLDVFMPGMDGYETAHLIRQREQSKRIPIIFLSAVNKEDAHLLRGYSMGAVDYVFKPVEAVVLQSKVAVFVDLYEKTREIQRKAAQEQRLLDENLRIQGERLLAEQALRRSEERQALIVQSLPIILYLEPLDANPRVPQFVGGNFKALTGYEFAHLKEEPNLWADRLHEEDRERVLAALSARLRTGAMAVEYRWRCADGQYKHFLDQAVVLHDTEGRPREFAGSLLDVSDRRVLEGQLVQAQKMDAIGKLTGGIAHDFNNLLAAVLGGLGLIERRCALDEQGRKLLAMSRHAAEQGTELVRRLLAFARRQQLEPATIPIARLASTVQDLLAHTLGGLVHIDWRADPDLWPVLADESQLELALMNLIINARDAMPDGGAIEIGGANRTVQPGQEAELAAGDYVVLVVADCGVGIAPHLLGSIFEPFFTTKEVGKGTGLGLSMVYGFAQQSGGTVRISSTLGKGTRVELWLPRASADEQVESPEQAAHHPIPGKIKPLRILLADDHPGVRATTAALIEELGHRVSDAGGGSEILALVEKTPDAFDLIVTDYAMPLLSGTELVRRIREIRPDMPAIIVTGYADITTIANRPENVILLTKPYVPQQIDHAIRMVMEPRAAA
jgi:signal transduction histidine kinase/two-component SAPR family response regulator